MEFVDFNQSHIAMALKIAKDNYEKERQQVSELPENVTLPDLTHFAENGLGVTAIQDGQVLGFICPYLPREDAFGTTMVRGTFVPMNAHGVATHIAEEDRGRIYSKLYQATAAKLIKRGIRSHAIALYTHDQSGARSFFYNGFGLRCIDLIRSIDVIPEDKTLKIEDQHKVEYVELFRDEWVLLLDQHNGLISHLANSPSFMMFTPLDEAALYQQTSEDVRYFAAKVNARCVAYIKLSDRGENFATEVDEMMNICGAYCETEYRGSGLYHNLLCYVMKKLQSEGYRLLGVDCESFNPTARGFWLKYFKEYTHSVVRRIDEKAVDEAMKEQ